MHYVHLCSGTCSRAIELDIDDNGNLHNVRFVGGCGGNTAGICALVEGTPAAEAAKRLRGLRCGSKPTSCPDQLSIAIDSCLAEK